MIPATSISQIKTYVDWKYKSERMNNACLGFKGNRAHLSRGKALGGSSTINGMIYTRGLQSDYDNWAEMGNTGWSWKDVEPYFKKLEKLENSSNVNYGKAGHVQLSLRETLTDLQNILKESIENMGIPYSNNEERSGAFTVPFTIGEGRRSSSAKAYLTKSKIRSNLYLALNTLVTKVTMRCRRAIGIEILSGGITLKVRATREVILSGGAVNSPQLLMLSGIGPRKHLEVFKIPVRSNLQVGENLQDHIFDSGLYVKLNPLNKSTACTDVLRYCIYKNGNLAKNNIFDFIWSLNTISNQEEPNVQIHLSHILQGEGLHIPSFMTLFGFNRSVTKSAERIVDSHDALLMGALLTKPKSRGRLQLKTTNPIDHLIIHAGYLNDENNEDINILVNTVDHIKKLLNTSPMKELNPEIVYLDLPGCEGIDVNSRDYWECHYRHTACTSYHLVGSCKMGPVGDKMAVTDPRLKVHGIRGLRVVDASIMPTITNRNTNAPSLMIGERAADYIKEDHGYINR